MQTALLIALLLFATTFLAGWAVGLFPWHGRWSSSLLAFATGILLAAAMAVAIPEGFDWMPRGTPDRFLAGVTLLAGFLLPLFFGGRSTSGRMTTGLTVHALVEGVPLGGGIATGHLPLILSLLVAVLSHKWLVAFSFAAFLKEATPSGMDRGRRFVLPLLTFSLATPLGVLMGTYLFERLPAPGASLGLLFSAGSFLYVATAETLFKLPQPPPKRLILLGILLITALQLALERFPFTSEMGEGGRGERASAGGPLLDFGAKVLGLGSLGMDGSPFPPLRGNRLRPGGCLPLWSSRGSPAPVGSVANIRMDGEPETAIGKSAQGAALHRSPSMESLNASQSLCGAGSRVDGFPPWRASNASQREVALKFRPMAFLHR